MSTNTVSFMRTCIIGETDVEGGWVKGKDDLGGETNHGITIATAGKYKSSLISKFGWDGNMKTLTQDMAFWIYEQEFWKPMYLDDVAALSNALARSMFRWGLKSGSTRPVTAVQETLNCLNNKGEYWDNIKADGYMGPTTLATIRKLEDKRGHYPAMAFLVAQTNADQMAWMKYITIKRAKEANETYYWGWGVRCIRETVAYVKSYYFKEL